MLEAAATNSDRLDMQIRKRDGRIVKYDNFKINNAIWKAVKSVGGTDYEYTTYLTELVETIIEEQYESNEYIDVETIQDIVEEVLIKQGHDKVAKSYILYRQQHKEIREMKTHMNEISVVDDYIELSTWTVKENSNQTFSLQGLNNHISSNISQKYWLNKIYSEEIKNSHINGDFHIHDLGLIATYCFTGDTKIPLLNGEIKTLEELANTHKEKTFWVYSIDELGNIVPGLARNPRKTRTEADLVKVTLDNKKVIHCTPDHPFLMRNGEYQEASKLKAGDSLMPLYLYQSFRGTDYTGVYNPANNERQYLHRILMKCPADKVCHHIDANKTNNEPTNLKLLDERTHRSLELIKTMKTDKWKESNRQVLNKRNRSEEMRKISTKNTIKRNKTDRQRASLSFAHKKGISINKQDYLNYVDQNGYLPISQFALIQNHKIVSVESIDYKADVYDITVDKYHNFALEAGVFVHNCVGWSLNDLLTYGFTGVEGKISSSPAKHFRALLGQIVNFFYTLQGESAGAQAFSNFDTLIAPYIYYDNLTYEQVKQGIQEFIFNMNVPTRVGFQTPFTNITMDLKVPQFMKNEPAIVGGKMMDKTYGDFQNEMNMLNKAFAEIMSEGDAQGRVFTFPIPTYSITEDFDWDDPNYDIIWEMTAKYGIPYFSNFINSDLNPEDVRSMCCRLRLDTNELRKRGGGLFGSNPLTGSIGVVTINLPRIGLLSANKEDFFIKLKELMDLAKDSLEIKRKVIEKLTEENLYPYSRFYLESIKQRMGSYWANHFSTIGLIGMNEACLNLFCENIASEKGLEFSKEVMYFMRDTISQYQDETGNLYNLEATPAEGCSYTLLLKDNKYFGEQPYKNYTNSTQLPVNYTRDLFSALKHQEILQTLYTGGTVFHTFLGEAPSAESAKKLIKKMCYQFELPYYSLTPTFSICPDHGYLKGEQLTCPLCEKEGTSTECEIYSRVVGYLRPVKQWNTGKQAEYSSRLEYSL